MTMIYIYIYIAGPYAVENNYAQSERTERQIPRERGRLERMWAQIEKLSPTMMCGSGTDRVWSSSNEVTPTTSDVDSRSLPGNEPRLQGTNKAGTYHYSATLIIRKLGFISTSQMTKLKGCMLLNTTSCFVYVIAILTTQTMVSSEKKVVTVRCQFRSSAFLSNTMVN
jgi:hypothetical protein